MATEQQQPITFGEYVRRLRRAKGWTAVTAADATGIASTHLSRLENDRMCPNAETVVQIHNALGGDLVEMLRLAACVPMEVLALLEAQPDVFAQGYHESGRELDDLRKGVITLSEFCARYKDERDEYRGQVWDLDERVRELERERDSIRDRLWAEQRGRYERQMRTMEITGYWIERALVWQLRAERWKEAARLFRSSRNHWAAEFNTMVQKAYG